MSTPTLGASSAGPIRLDLDRLVISRALIQANSGAGKTWAIRRLLEQTHGRIQHLVLDSEGEFHTLRERFDYILAAPADGDCVADPRTAKLLARRLLELRVSAILDIYDLNAQDRRRFVRIFLESLINAPRSLWHPALVVVDEAHVFCPQAGQAESAGAVIDLMTRGRKRGFCGILATQRISKLHKDAAAEANNKLIGRSALDVDMGRAADELGFRTREEQRQLRTLDPGEFFGFGPAISSEVTKLRIGTVATTHQQAGRQAPPPTPPSKAIRDALAKLTDLPKQASDEAATLETLQRRVRELEAEARKRPAPAEPKVERVEVPVVSDAVVARLEAAVAAAREVGAEIATAAGDVSQQLVRAKSVRGPQSSPSRVEKPARIAPTATESHQRRESPQPSAEGIDGPMQRILDALAWLEAAGRPSPYSRVQVAFLARYKPGTGAFQNALGRLRTGGLVAYPSAGDVDLTDSGRATARAPDAPLDAVGMQAMVRERIDGPMRRCLDPLIEAYPQSLARENLAADAGYTAGTGAFQNALGRLRSLELIDYPDKGHAVALPVLFLEAR